LPGALSNYFENGHNYSVPLGYYASVIWYNAKMFRERGWQIVVNDSDHALTIIDGGVGGVAQVHEKRFVRFIERVAIDRDDDGLGRLAGGEGD
jgi:hypothetical protein